MSPYCLDCRTSLRLEAHKRSQMLECFECGAVWNVHFVTPDRFAMHRAERVADINEEVSPVGPVLYQSHQSRDSFIRAEVEAMDWPEVIGE